MKVKIYTLESIDGEVRYIGKTTRLLEKRLNEHLRDVKTYKGKWVQSLKYKPKIKLLDIVLEGESNFWECYWISLFKSWGFSLTNLTEGGDGGKGFKHSEKTKRIIGEYSRNIVFTEDRKKKISESKKGKKFPKISESKKGSKHSEETKRKIGLKSKGRRHSEKTKKILSEKFKKRWEFKSDRKVSEETKRKISKALSGREIPKDIIEKSVKSRKNNDKEWHSKETRKKISEANRGHKVSEETRKKISETFRKKRENK